MYVPLTMSCHANPPHNLTPSPVTLFWLLGLRDIAPPPSYGYLLTGGEVPPLNPDAHQEPRAAAGLPVLRMWKGMRDACCAWIGGSTAPGDDAAWPPATPEDTLSLQSPTQSRAAPQVSASRLPLPRGPFHANPAHKLTRPSPHKLCCASQETLPLSLVVLLGDRGELEVC